MVQPPPSRVLVAEDDPTVADVLLTYLRHAEMEADHVGDGQAALEQLAAARAAGRPYDAVVLDLMLPSVDGLEICRQLRSQSAGSSSGSPTHDTAVLMLTARGSEEERVLGLEVGADDYVTKPFSPREVVLRLRAILRRTAQSAHLDQAGPYRDGDLELDPIARTVTQAGQPLALTTREFDLLAHLLANPGVALGREQLLSQVWGWDFGDLSTVTVHVRRLRTKIELDPNRPTRLVTVWGVGYRWDATVIATPVPGLA
jgi:two-component system response regulator ResD